VTETETEDPKENAGFPLAGALLGTCLLGGPVGLFAGVHIGGIAALSGMAFGTKYIDISYQ
jgi:hypothetical protein